MKKPLDIFCEIVAWLLSITLVITLLVTPFVFSVLSLMSTKTIAKVVSEVLNTKGLDEEPRMEGVEAVTLSNVTKTASGTSSGKEALSEMFGGRVTTEKIDAILESKAAKELIAAYTEDLTNAFSNNGESANFTTRKIKRVVEDNIDEIVDILREVDSSSKDMKRSELREKILAEVDEHAQELVDMLPDPQDLRDDFAENAPLLEMVFKIFAMRNAIKSALIVFIVILSGLLFVCRLRWKSGFCWLGVDFLTAGGLGMLIAIILSVATSAIGESIEMYGSKLVSLAGSLLSVFTGGLLSGFGIILALGGLFLAAHFLLKKFVFKKNQPQSEPVQQNWEYMV